MSGGAVPASGPPSDGGEDAGTTRHPSLKDLVAILYRPRATIRRILDSGRPRWSSEVVVLAAVCSAYVDPDIQRTQFLTLSPKLAIAALGLIVNAFAWVLVVYLFSWVATLVGRRLEGEGAYADVRAAIAWALVPHIWSIAYRIPVSSYLTRFNLTPGQEHRIIADFISQGGCSVVVVVFAIQILIYGWIVYLASACVGEALHFSSWKGLGTVAITGAIPVIIAIAAIVASRT